MQKCLKALKICPSCNSTLIEEIEVKLTSTEYKLLECLSSKPGWVFTRGQLINELNGDNHAVTDRSIDVQIVGLRKKLGTAGKFIETLRGVGYRIRDSAF